MVTQWHVSIVHKDAHLQARERRKYIPFASFTLFRSLTVGAVVCRIAPNKGREEEDYLPANMHVNTAVFKN